MSFRAFPELDALTLARGFGSSRSGTMSTHGAKSSDGDELFSSADARGGSEVERVTAGLELEREASRRGDKDILPRLLDASGVLQDAASAIIDDTFNKCFTFTERPALPVPHVGLRRGDTLTACSSRGARLHRDEHCDFPAHLHSGAACAEAGTSPSSSSGSSYLRELSRRVVDRRRDPARSPRTGRAYLRREPHGHHRLHRRRQPFSSIAQQNKAGWV